MKLNKHIAQRALYEARQADRGLIKALRTGKPGAVELAAVMPLKRQISDREWRAHAELFLIELEESADV